MTVFTNTSSMVVEDEAVTVTEPDERFKFLVKEFLIYQNKKNIDIISICFTIAITNLHYDISILKNLTFFFLKLYKHVKKA